MSENTDKKVDEAVKEEILSYTKFKAQHSGLTKEQFDNVSAFIPGTRSTFPGYAAGFVQGGQIGTTLAPEITAAPSGLEVASFPMFNKEGFYSGDDDTVAINSGRKTTGLSVKWQTETLDAHAMDAPVDVRLQRALASSGIDASLSALDLARRQVENHKEVAIAKMFRSTGSYASSAQYNSESGTSLWGNAASTPIPEIFAAVETVRSLCGMRPNYFWMSPKAFRNLRINPTIINLTKFGGTPTSLGGPATQDALGAFFGMNIVIGDNLTTTSLNGALSDAWGTDAGLCVVADNNVASPKFAATFTSAGSPLVMPAYLDRRFGAEGSMIYSYVDYYKPFITMNTAAFLFINAGS